MTEEKTNAYAVNDRLSVVEASHADGAKTLSNLQALGENKEILENPDAHRWASISKNLQKLTLKRDLWRYSSVSFNGCQRDNTKKNK
jgi:hypothetical protein